jgi:hypothetical protein
MKTTNHTPGPWSIEWNHQSNTPDFIRSFVNGEMQDIAEMSGEGKDSETLANANLIASAPDLLSALRFLLADYVAIEGETLTGSSVPADMARAAIAKAEGVA